MKNKRSHDCLKINTGGKISTHIRLSIGEIQKYMGAKKQGVYGGVVAHALSWTEIHEWSTIIVTSPSFSCHFFEKNPKFWWILMESLNHEPLWSTTHRAKYSTMGTYSVTRHSASGL